MKKTERLESATTPDGTVLTLYRHDGAYTIRIDGVELMSTRRHHSEETLAELVCRPLENTPGARVIIGGLGLGYTLKAALRALPADAQVVMVEIVAEVITWNENPEYALSGDALKDPRVDLRHDDVANVLRANPGAYDAVMLDLDNGADALTDSGNAQLYSTDGIRMAAASLRPNGRLAYWSADRDAKFEHALRVAGLKVKVERVRAHTTAGGYYTLFIARAD